MALREHILNEIKRLGNLAGKPPGKQVFSRETGIKEHEWSGLFWARWSDALKDAGFEKNELQGRFSTDYVLSQIVLACRHYMRLPTSAEMRLYRRHHPLFPSHNTITNHFPKRSALVGALIQYVNARSEFEDVGPLLPSHDVLPGNLVRQANEGSVYLLKSGGYYKIGRSDELERRVKEIRVSLPETISLVHAIRTDDPPGIEAYWHRRFSNLRANGEWFKLGPNELAAFKRRKYQ